MAIEQHLVDKRVIRRNLAQGKVDPNEYRQWLEALPDRSDRLSSRESDRPSGAPADQ